MRRILIVVAVACLLGGLVWAQTPADTIEPLTLIPGQYFALAGTDLGPADGRRVELGNAKTYQDCTRWELQDPKRWNDTAVVFKVKPGSFTHGETIWVFMVSTLDSVLETTWPFTIGGTLEGPGKPGQPGPGQPGKPTFTN